MPVQTASLLASNSTDANFRAWGSGVSGLLSAAGFVKTADTGQINWTTVLAPTVATTAQGYEIWRFADTLQTSYPIVFKVEYGSSSPATMPSIWITVGTGSNGSGTITSADIAGVTMTPIRTQCVGSGSYTWAQGTGTCYLTTDSTGSGLMLALWPNLAASSSAGSITVIERARDHSGTATGQGYLFLTASSPSSLSWTQVSYEPWQTNAATANSSGLVNSTISYVSTLIDNTVWPVPIATSGRDGQSALVLAMCPDIARGATTSITHLGEAHTWLMVGPAPSNGYDLGQVSNQSTSSLKYLLVRID